MRQNDCNISHWQVASARQGTREWVVRKYPYILVYEVHGNEIMILGVFHAAQHRSEER